MTISKFNVSNLQFNYNGTNDEVESVNVYFNCRILNDKNLETGQFNGQVLLSTDDVKSFAIKDISKAVIDYISKNVLGA